MLLLLLRLLRLLRLVLTLILSRRLVVGLVLLMMMSNGSSWRV